MVKLKLNRHGLPLRGFRWKRSVQFTGVTFEGLKRWARQWKRRKKA